MEQYSIVYTRLDVKVGRSRRIVSEDHERIVVPMSPGLDVVPTAVGMDTLLSSDGVRITAARDCRIVGTITVPAAHIKVFDVGFTHHVAPGRPCQYRVTVEYELGNGVVDGADTYHVGSNMELIGFNRAVAVAVIRVSFPAGDVPTRCLQTTEDRKGSGVLDVAELKLSPHGVVQCIISDPTPGWYGVRWVW